MRLVAGVLGAVALLGVAGGPAIAAPAPSLVKMTADILYEPAVKDGVILVAPYGIDAAFLVDTRNTGQRAKALALLEQARKDRKTIVLEYDPKSGQLELDRTLPFFRVAGLQYGQNHLVIEDSRTGSAPDVANAPSARAVAAGFGLKYAGEWDSSIRELKAALADPVLPPNVRALAFKALGDMAKDKAEGDYDRSSTQSDSLLIEALADYRSEGSEDSNSTASKVGIAWVLMSLGAYDEALAAYEDLAKNVKAEFFWGSIAVSYVHRTIGEYDRALKALDDLARAQGPMNNMPYHYHRGLTLLAMDRPIDASDEFTIGLKHQPDYVWAYMHRACAYGRQGRLKEALADAQKGSELMAQFLQPKTLARDVHDRARAVAVVQELSAAAASGKATQSDSACKGFWPDAYERRARSPLLPKVVPDGPATSA